jgi:sterol desaturase/sphingolipid hydroxylase (fatty acid hydroxylase superfamily)
VKSLAVTGDELIIVGSYALAALAVVGEVTWIAAKRGKSVRVMKSLGVGVALLLGSLLLSIPYSAIAHYLLSALRASSPAAVRSTWRSNPLAAYVVCFLAWDLAGFTYHWLGHRTRVGWASHQPHHTGDSFDITIALRQSWTPIFALPTQVWVGFLGFDIRTIAICAAVSNLMQLLQHSSVCPRLPRFVTAVLMTPESHQLHHRYGDVNLGPVFTIWDRITHTWTLDSTRPVAKLSARAASHNPFRLAFGGWVDLIRMLR